MSSIFLALLLLAGVTLSAGQGWGNGGGGWGNGGGGWGGPPPPPPPGGGWGGGPGGGGGWNNGGGGGWNNGGGWNGGNSLGGTNNLQANGCGWDFAYRRCRDIFNTCQGGCRNFGSSIFSDCRCVPYGAGK